MLNELNSPDFIGNSGNYSFLPHGKQRRRRDAKILKTTQQQYSKIETGQADISGEKLILLAQIYNVSCDYILGLVKEPRPLR